MAPWLDRLPLLVVPRRLGDVNAVPGQVRHLEGAEQLQAGHANSRRRRIGVQLRADRTLTARRNRSLCRHGAQRLHPRLPGPHQDAHTGERRCVGIQAAVGSTKRPGPRALDHYPHRATNQGAVNAWGKRAGNRSRDLTQIHR